MPGELEGFIYDMPFDEYAKVDALNGSSIIHMRRSPMKYRHEKDHPTLPSPAMFLGVLTHRMILEPATMNSIAVWGELPEQKVRNGRIWDAFREANADKIIMTTCERDECEEMAISALNNEPIQKYAAAQGRTEVSCFWRHPHTKRRYKCRFDKIIPETNIVFDLKTTRDCRSFKFGAQSYALGYHVKMAIQYQGYLAVTGTAPQMRLGAVESKAPHESAVYRLTHDVIMQGIEDLDILVAKLDECEKVGKWPAEFDQETDLLLPSWATETNFGDGEVA